MNTIVATDGFSAPLTPADFEAWLNGTLGPQPVGNTLHGGIGLRVNY